MKVINIFYRHIVHSLIPYDVSLYLHTFCNVPSMKKWSKFDTLTIIDQRGLYLSDAHPCIELNGYMLSWGQHQGPGKGVLTCSGYKIIWYKRSIFKTSFRKVHTYIGYFAHLWILSKYSHDILKANYNCPDSFYFVFHNYF